MLAQILFKKMYSNSNNSTPNNSGNSIVKESLQHLGGYVVNEVNDRSHQFKSYLAQRKQDKLEKEQKIKAKQEFQQKAEQYYKKYLLRKQLRQKQSLAKRQSGLETGKRSHSVSVVEIANQNQHIAIESLENLTIPNTLKTKEQRIQYILDAVSENQGTAKQYIQLVSKLVADKPVEKVAKRQYSQNHFSHLDEISKEAILQTFKQVNEASIIEIKKENLSKGFSNYKRLQPRLAISPDKDRLVVRPKSTMAHTLQSPLSQPVPNVPNANSSISYLFGNPTVFLGVTAATIKVAYKNNKVVDLLLLGSYKLLMQIIKALKKLATKVVNLDNISWIRAGYYNFGGGPYNYGKKENKTHKRMLTKKIASRSFIIVRDFISTFFEIINLILTIAFFLYYQVPKQAILCFYSSTLRIVPRIVSRLVYFYNKKKEICKNRPIFKKLEKFLLFYFLLAAICDSPLTVVLGNLIQYHPTEFYDRIYFFFIRSLLYASAILYQVPNAIFQLIFEFVKGFFVHTLEIILGRVHGSCPA